MYVFLSDFADFDRAQYQLERERTHARISASEDVRIANVFARKADLKKNNGWKARHRSRSVELYCRIDTDAAIKLHARRPRGHATVCPPRASLHEESS